LSKWYRLSLSLAAKCRLGFAFAVLLIIAAGLFVPYRWMDKLVEQGKHELAQAEVQHVLQRHFHPVETAKTSSSSPSLTSSDESSQSSPVTSWISLAQFETAETAAGAAERMDELITDDPFLRRGVKLLLNDSTIPEIFELQTEPFVGEAARPDTSPTGDSILKSLTAVMPSDRPARYLRAVRAKADCLATGCHATRLSDTGDKSGTSPIKDPSSFSEGQLLGVISVILPAGQTSITLLFNRVFIVVGGLLSCICAVVLFYLITQRFILEPVRSLRAAADEVTAASTDSRDQPEPSQDSWLKAIKITAEIKTGDEYEKLAQAFHQMLSRLKLAHDRLRETNRALDLRLDELEARNIALFESNKLKSEFLANVSHELRTPLNAIIGFTEILKEQALSSNDEKSIRYTANVLESGHLLLRIINELLELAKIEAGKAQVHWEKCSIDTIVETLLNLTRPLAQEKNLTVNLDVAENLPSVETDQAKLQHILFNLIDNAIKFTPDNGRIDITAYLSDHDTFPHAEPAEPQPDPGTDTAGDAFVQICVSDTGPGIAPEDREKIFDKFFQLDGTVTRRYSGAGLGLAIVKELTQILGASISVGSNSPQGTTFTITLPVKHAADVT